MFSATSATPIVTSVADVAENLTMQLMTNGKNKKHFKVRRKVQSK